LWVRRAAKWLPVVAVSCAFAWALARHFDSPTIISVGAGGIACILVLMMSQLVALLLTSPFRGVELLIDAVRRFSVGPSTAGVQPADRRRFLRSALSAVPLLTASTASYGVMRSSTAARITPVNLRYLGLAPGLDGFKILHLSDIHLGSYIDREDLEQLAQRASQFNPDLIAVTGDICDHMPWYLDALRIVEQMRPPAGVFASLGNHEHYGGLDQVLRSFERSQVRLLVDDGQTLRVRAADAGATAGTAALFISGCDDPQSMRGPESLAKLRRFVDKSQHNAPVEAFRVLMSHRSQAFDYAAPLGVDLTLSGHTHGFQLGSGGRSLFENFYPDHYIWGHYQKGNQQLYTSAGVGHWFPFRLGCPPEAPLITLSAHEPHSTTT